jgi:hypothetical protein
MGRYRKAHSLADEKVPATAFFIQLTPSTANADPSPGLDPGPATLPIAKQVDSVVERTPPELSVTSIADGWSRTRMGGWAVAQSPILGTTITLNKLAKRGYQSLLSYYLQVTPSRNEPLYT